MGYARLNRPISAGLLVWFRVAFGLAMAWAGVRFFTHDWVTKDFAEPTHFFHYWGFGWVQPLPPPGMTVVFVLMTASALAIAAGVAYRCATILFAITFTYAHLCDKANYLNHYYFIILIAGWLVVLPKPQLQQATRAWVLYALRFQVALVYIFGGIGKLNSDWLVHGEPLKIWLSANAEMPLLGRFFDSPATALIFSWTGAIFDLAIVPALLYKKTRLPAYVTLVVFHVLTALLFNIGMFPWIMIIAASLFFEPGPASETTVRPLKHLYAFAVYATFQILMPLRAHLYPGNTLWSEEGFRFAWRVMLIEKSGELEYTVRDADGHTRTVSPREYLTPFQARMAATQPDFILELAHWIADDARRHGQTGVQVFADARVSFNGRLSAPLVDPTVDLAQERDTLSHKKWIEEAPQSAPVF